MPELFFRAFNFLKKISSVITSVRSFFSILPSILYDKKMQLVAVMNFVGVIPYYLTGSTLMIWMLDTGFSISSISMMYILNLPHALKFIWAHLFDSFAIPFLSKRLGLRRSWLLLCSFFTICCLFAITLVDINTHLYLFFVLIFCANFFIASYNILLLAVQMEAIDKQKWGYSEAMNVLGFRTGVIFASAGAILISDFMDWSYVYRFMLCTIIPGVIFIYCTKLDNIVREPEFNNSSSFFKNFKNSILIPLKDLTSYKNIYSILFFMLIYCLHDHLLANLHKMFHLKLGFSKFDLAFVDNTFGMFMTLLGGFISGLAIQKYGYIRVLKMGSWLSLLVGPMLILQNYVGTNLVVLYMSIMIQEIVHGFTMTAFFTYQMNFCSIKFAVSQLSLLKAFDALGKYGFGCVSGFIVEGLGWTGFFIGVSLAPIPGFLILKRMNILLDNSMINMSKNTLSK